MSGLAVMFGSDGQSGKVRAGEAQLGLAGTTDLRLLGSEEHEDFTRIHIPGNFPRLKVRPNLRNVRVILNLITDPDINPRVLDHAARFLKSFPGKILNRPEMVLATTRDRVAARLGDIDGLLVPRVARFRGRPNLAMAALERSAMRFPAILRETGTHDGRIEGLIADSDAMLARIDATKSYYLTEFVDIRSDDGLYHKIRVFFFGSAAVVRHRLVSDRWNIHAAERQRVLAHRPEAIEQERRLVEGGFDALPSRVRGVLTEIRSRMALDFFGIDFAIMPDGRVLLFEANATMMFFPVSTDPLFSYGAAALRHGQAAYAAMLQSA